MRERDLFILALELAIPAEREAFLDAECGEDAVLRRRVGELFLEHHRQASFFLDETPQTFNASTSRSIAERPGVQIGRYRLLQQIGEGGFGVVFMADQTSPISRRVALKIIKPGMDSGLILARFEAERQALALMDHFNIARVFDGGTTENGRPYFVMELVHGIPITQFCDENRLTLRQRLELFIPVCQAIQHAHQKGIIHRDIKPANVLVTLCDGRPIPKVIDFGIAKATEQRLTNRTMFTHFGTMVGTLEYMSPEQAEMSALGVDTRSDIYSLGVLLYELLTGSTPLTHQRMKRADYVELLRLIKEEEPQKPSTRLSSSGDSLASIAACRHTEPIKLVRLVRGELEWIVLKAIDKDRKRRYETANAFGLDIDRYLRDESVLAYPPSPAYRLTKFVRRNRGTVVAVSLLSILLIGGIVGTSWGMVRAINAERATRAEVVETKKAKREAERQAAAAISLAESLKQMLGLLDPDANHGANYSVLDLIDDYAVRLEDKLQGQPEAAAELHAAVGRAYACRGQREKAQRHLERALSLSVGVYGDQHDRYADFLVESARPDASDPLLIREREADLRRALEIYRARGVSGERVIRALWTLQWNLVTQANGSRAPIEPILREALLESEKSPDVEFPLIASIHHAMAGVEIDRGRFSEGEAIARKAIAMHLRLHKDSLETAWAHFALAKALRGQRKFAEASAADLKAISMMRHSLPIGHVNIAYALAGLNRTLNGAQNSNTLAEPLFFASDVAASEIASVFQDVLATTEPTTLNYADPVMESVRGLITCVESRFYRCRKLAATMKELEAESARREAMAMLQELEHQVAASPKLAHFVYGTCVLALTRAGQVELARELGNRLIHDADAASVEVLNNVAWLLATAPIPSHRDPAMAVDLALKAIEFNTHSSAYFNTLGVARYRAGDSKQAIIELKQSIAIGGGSSCDYYFLAMAHWQLGEKDAALNAYQQAVRMTNSNEPLNAEIRGFRDECERMMHDSNSVDSI